MRRIKANESLYVAQYRIIGRSTFWGSQIQYAGENVTDETITDDLQRIGKESMISTGKRAQSHIWDETVQTYYYKWGNSTL